MGAIYRPKYQGPTARSANPPCAGFRFRQHGKTVRQSTDTADERKARAILREKEGKVALNIPVSPTGDRLTLDGAAAMIRADYAARVGDFKSYAIVDEAMLRATNTLPFPQDRYNPLRLGA